MDFQQLIEAMTPEIYQTMKTSVELGKWPDGNALTEQQKETVIQAIMVYDAKHHGEHDEPFRVRADGSILLGKANATRQLNSSSDQIILKKLMSNE